MFGPDMFSKLAELQANAEATKEKLNQLEVEGEAGGGLIIVTVNGNRALKSLKINTDHRQMELEDLEDLLTIAFQRALEKANTVNEQEIQQSARNLFPGM